MATERFALHNHTTPVLAQSAIVPRRMVVTRHDLICPRCGQVHKGGVEHGRIKECECGLTLAVRGNCLEICNDPVIPLVPAPEEIA